MPEGKKWSNSTILQATEIAAADQFLIIQASTGLSKRITHSVIQASSGNNLVTVSYTIGVYGVTGVDYNFTSVANSTKQSIQLGATTIIPANSKIIQIVGKCETGINSGTGTVDIGTTSGGSDYWPTIDLDATDEMWAGALATPAFISPSVSSVWFSFDPSVNWDTLTTGKWKVWISYLDNSIL